MARYDARKKLFGSLAQTAASSTTSFAFPVAPFSRCAFFPLISRHRRRPRDRRYLFVNATTTTRDKIWLREALAQARCRTDMSTIVGRRTDLPGRRRATACSHCKTSPQRRERMNDDERRGERAVKMLRLRGNLNVASDVHVATRLR